MRNEICESTESLQQQAESRLQALVSSFLSSDAEEVTRKEESLYDLDTQDTQEVITVEKIPFCALCEHHLVPFFGEIQLSYIPNSQILGLSRFAKIIQKHSKRLTLQEKLGAELVSLFKHLLQPQAILLKIAAYHACAAMKQPDKNHTPLTTLHFAGDASQKLYLASTLKDSYA